MYPTRLIRRFRLVERKFREARMFADAVSSPRHPIMAHIVPIRRCNLSCAYCNEYDNSSKPVPMAEMIHRVDQLARLGTSIVTISGGEPLLHPDLEEIIRSIRARRMIATLISNGYLLTPQRIMRLNRAGLDQFEISIDNVLPDDVSKKSLKVLDPKLAWLNKYAVFDVCVNSVIGASFCAPEDTIRIALRARSLGFKHTIGIVHDRSGQLRSLTEQQQTILNDASIQNKSVFSFARYNEFQMNLAHGLPNRWHCRAGSRYLYICEDGMVHWCSQQRGHPGIPLDRYGREQLDHEFHSIKSCAPYCTIGCVHRVAMLDSLREEPRATLDEWMSSTGGKATRAKHPPLVRLLSWIYLAPKSSIRRRLFVRLTLRLLGVSQS
jgi:MoaA/NifB/PqqE/SkfB family radical SAM enzyme